MFIRKEICSFDFHKNHLGIGTMTWSPLACGLLTGKYEDGVPVHSRASLRVKTKKKLRDDRSNVF